MKNIMHLEDLAFYEHPATILEIVSALIHTVLTKNKSKQISIKYDGAPLIVFGNEEGFFVSNKSYLNKDPIRYRSMDEIENANVHEDVKDKLAAVFHEYADAKIPDGIVYFADYLFSNYWHPRDGTAPITSSFHPNIINYKLRRGSLEAYQLGLAFHTRKFCGIDIELHFPASSSVWTPSIYPDISDGFKSYEPFDLLRSVYRDSLLENHSEASVKDLRRKMNGFVRENGRYHRNQLAEFRSLGLTELEKNIDTLVKIKYKILEHLNRGEHNQKTFEMSINGCPTNHEGYVFKYNNKLIKIVDRYIFSKANFSESTHRGWQRDTGI